MARECVVDQRSSIIRPSQVRILCLRWSDQRRVLYILLESKNKSPSTSLRVVISTICLVSADWCELKVIHYNSTGIQLFFSFLVLLCPTAFTLFNILANLVVRSLAINSSSTSIQPPQQHKEATPSLPLPTRYRSIVQLARHGCSHFATLRI